MTDPALADIVDPSVLAERRARRSARSLGETLADARAHALGRERAALLGSLGTVHEAQTARIASLEADLVDARRDRDRLAAELAAERAERAAADTALAEARAAAEVSGAALATAREEAAGVRVALAEARGEAEAAFEALADARGEIAAAGAAVSVARDEAEAVGAALAQALGEAEAASAALADARSDAAAALAAGDGVRAERDAVATARDTLAATLALERTARASLAEQLAAARRARDAIAAELEAARDALGRGARERSVLASELAAARAALDELGAARRREDAASGGDVAGVADATAGGHPAPPADPATAGGDARDGLLLGAERRARGAVGVGPADLARYAREQAAAASAGQDGAGVQAARIAADLDRAAAALRARVSPDEGDPAARADAAAPSAARSSTPEEPLGTDQAPRAPVTDGAPPRLAAAQDARPRARARVLAPAPPPLRTALAALARRDPATAGDLLAGLLRAHGAVAPGWLDYDLTIRGVGTFAVSIAGSATSVRPVARPRGRHVASFHLAGDPAALAELLAGERRRIPWLNASLRLRGRRRPARATLSATRRGVRLADLARAGAALDPAAAMRLLPDAIPPGWTRGHRFVVEHVVGGTGARPVYVHARDGARLLVTDRATGDADAVVRMTAETFAALVREEPVPAGRRPVVRGDRAAVAALQAWIDGIRVR